MIVCGICQVSNDDSSPYCVECGSKLPKIVASGQQTPHSIWNSDDLTDQSFDTPAKTNQPQPVSPKHSIYDENDMEEDLPISGKQKLRSPLLSGYEDDNDNTDYKPQTNKNQTGQNKGKLKSPLLGGSDFDQDDDYDQPKSNNLKSSGKSKLHSPLLGGSNYDQDDDYDQPKSNNLKSSGKPKLHSPLLGGSNYDQDDDYDQPKSNNLKSSGKSKLHSPLLGGSNYDQDDDYDQPRPNNLKSSGKPKLHSPLLGGSNYDQDDDYDQPKSNNLKSSGKPKLHSPLLGDSNYDQDDDYEENIKKYPKRPIPPSQSKVKLKSPLLGGSSDYEDDYDYSDEEPEIITDPNVLRSPLLLSKVHNQESKPKTNLAQPQPQPQAQAQAQSKPQLQSSSPYTDEETDEIVDEPKIINKPGFSENPPNSKFISQTSNKTFKNNQFEDKKPLSHKENLSQISNELDAEIDNSRMASMVKSNKKSFAKPQSQIISPALSEVSVNKVGQSLVFLAIFGLILKLGYVFMMVTQSGQPLPVSFYIDQASQILTIFAIMIALFQMSK